METQAYIIGKYYQMPTVRGYIFNTLYDWPVIGPMHTDVEIINFPYEHYHVDWRFVPQRLVDRMQYPERALAGLVLLINEAGQNVSGLPAPALKRVKCKRQFSDYPLELAARSWLRELENNYQDCRIKTPVCPHRGLPLDKLPCKHDSTVTCPGHGLTWNMKTGELVRFTNAD